LETDHKAPVVEQDQRANRSASIAAVVTSKAWALTRKLLSILRSHPGQRGSPLHIAVLADPLVRYSAAQAIGLRQAGANVTFYYVDRLIEFDGNEYERSLTLDEITVHDIDTVKLEPRRIMRTFTQTRTLLRDLRDRKVTGLIAQAHFDPRYALVNLRLPTLLVLHDPRPHSGDSDAPRWPAPVVARFAEGTASCLMIHSERLLPQVRSSLREVPMIVVPHGATVAPAPVKNPRSPVILVAGRLFAYKGVGSALDAFPTVQRKVPDAKLIVAGRGPMADEARQRGLDGILVEDGYVTEARLGTLLEESSVVLLPYHDATQSGMGLLAAGRGIPCVVSEQGALPDILGPLGEDLIWSTTDIADLAAAIIAALNRDDSFRTAIHERAATFFAWDVVGAKIISELVPYGFGVVPRSM
jgi:glycosyltransferase involved in cell wall biosynthesis